MWLNDPSSVYFRVSRLPESSSDVKNLKVGLHLLSFAFYESLPRILFISSISLCVITPQSIERIFGTAETDLLRHRLKFFQSGTGVQIPYLLNGSALTTG